MARSQLSFPFDHSALHRELDEALEEATDVLDQMPGLRWVAQVDLGRRFLMILAHAILPHSEWEEQRLLPRLGKSHVASELRFELGMMRRWLEDLDHMLHEERPRLRAFRRRAHDLLVVLKDHLREETGIALLMVG